MQRHILCASNFRLTGQESVSLSERSSEPEWVRGSRIGISKNKDAALRFWIPFDKTVSGRRGYPKA